MWCPAPSVCKWNKMINFVLAVKLKAKMHFFQDPQKPIFSTQIILFTFYRKKLRNKYLLATHDYYFMFKTFFSQVNNKGFFWWSIDLIIQDSSLETILIIWRCWEVGDHARVWGTDERGLIWNCIIWNAIWKLVTLLKEKWIVE